MQTQQTSRLQVFPVQIVALALGLFVALMLAGTFGFWLGGIRTSNAPPAAAPLTSVGQEQIAHDRSEQGLGGSGSADQGPFVVEQAPYSSPASSNSCAWVGTPPRISC